MSRIVFIAGLGADHRLYQNIQLPGHHLVYAHWLSPDKTDTLTTYANKLIMEYQIGAGDIVIGTSLGGMLAIEVAKQVALAKVILISSIKSSAEAPFYFQIFRRLPVHKLIPGKLFTSMGFLVRPLFAHLDKEGMKLFESMLRNSSPVFVKWAMHAVLQWRSDAVLNNVYHITGDKDQVFNYKRINGATIIPDGAHDMVYSKAEEINKWLKEVIG